MWEKNILDENSLPINLMLQRGNVDTGSADPRRSV
jgi:hypothetical protein